MTEEVMASHYFDWLVSLIADDEHFGRRSYYQLLSYLYSRDYAWSIPRDDNREADGMELRYRFGREKAYDSRVIAATIDIQPCSMLEMMVALAKRGEEQIMTDEEYGDRTPLWFWYMIRSLGFEGMHDNNFDICKAEEIIDNFLNHRYSRDGKGSLFYIPGIDRDMRQAELWYQMCWYFNTLIDIDIF